MSHSQFLVNPLFRITKFTKNNRYELHNYLNREAKTALRSYAVKSISKLLLIVLLLLPLILPTTGDHSYQRLPIYVVQFLFRFYWKFPYQSRLCNWLCPTGCHVFPSFFTDALSRLSHILCSLNRLVFVPYKCFSVFPTLDADSPADPDNLASIRVSLFCGRYWGTDRDARFDP